MVSGRSYHVANAHVDAGTDLEASRAVCLTGEGNGWVFTFHAASNRHLQPGPKSFDALLANLHSF